MKAARTYFLAALVFAVGSLPVVSATEASGLVRQIAEESSVSIPAIHFNSNGMVVIIKRGNGYQSGQQILLGLGDTDIGAPGHVSCKSDAGCEISIAAMVQMRNVAGAWAICSTVDGVAARPPCPFQNLQNSPLGVIGNVLQSLRVTKGTHTLQAHVFIRDNPNAGLGAWEVNYTLYEL